MKEKGKLEMSAILGEEFDRLLHKLGIAEDVKLGKYKCHVCGEQINLENALLIFPLLNDKVGFVCDRPLCLRKYKMSLEE